jgi:predicted esterase
LFLPLPVLAQPERYEVGQHLVAFEKAWEQHRMNAAAKKRALRDLLPVVPNFFAANWTNAARLLDQARFALAAKEPPPAAVRWAESLALVLDSRLLPRSADRLNVQLKTFYKTSVNIPAGAELVLQFNSNGKSLLPEVKAPIKELPLVVDLPAALPEGDHYLRAAVVVGGKALTTEEQLISVVDRPGERLKVLQKGLAQVAKNGSATDRKTAGYLMSLLEGLNDRRTFETNYPAARLLSEAEAALESLQSGKGYYGGDKTGQFWLKLATAKGDFVARLLAPDAVKKGKPLPLVVALHGAGASENLFFEGYGNGLIVKMCKQRGWLLVSPRSGYLVFTMPVGAIVDAVAKLYPVDRDQILVVGHSMGAAQALAAAQEDPKLFAAVAALGGSGKVTHADKIKRVPFFVGVGDSDFALEAARRTAKQLKAGGVEAVEFREYADVEHIMIVREALPEVFALFDKAVAGK